MALWDNPLYMEDVAAAAAADLLWEKLHNKTVFISGATGLIGSFLVDVLMYKNRSGLNCRVIAVCRNKERAEARFSYCGNDNLTIVSRDISKPLAGDAVPHVDFVLHLASNTHPVQYATDPIGTITTNIFGTYNLLEFAADCNAERFLLASSNEVYGENRGDVEKFNERYCGYIDSNTLRAGYPESKRCSEALCQAYLKQKNLDVVIARLTRCYGPTLLPTDTKALSQFIHKALAGEDIVLKSDGMQYYSYLYAADQVTALLTILLNGQSGEAYNIADDASDVRLKELAGIVARTAGQKVVFDLPDAVEAAGFSKATKARLESAKLQKLGWKAQYGIQTGIERTMQILRDIR